MNRQRTVVLAIFVVVGSVLGAFPCRTCDVGVMLQSFERLTTSTTSVEVAPAAVRPRG